MSTLSLSNLSTAVPNMFTIPVAFDPQASSVAGFQFDFPIPPGTSFQNVSAGPIVAAASKSLQTSVLQGNIIRVIVFGLNQTLILAGIGANIHLVSTASGTQALILQNAVASDPAGATVPLQTVGGTLTIASENPTVATTLAQLQTDLTALQGAVTNVQNEVNLLLPLANPDVTAEDTVVTQLTSALNGVAAAIKQVTGQ